MEDKQHKDLDNKGTDLTSDFNEAKQQIFRIGNAWVRCGNYAKEGKFDKWNWELDYLWRELSRDAEIADKNKDEGTYKQKMAALNNLIARHKASPDDLYKILERKEIILRRLQDESGKGSRRSSEEEEDDIDM